MYLYIIILILATARYVPPTAPPTRQPPTTPRTYIRPSVRSLEHHLPGSNCHSSDDDDIFDDDDDDDDDIDVDMVIHSRPDG